MCKSCDFIITLDNEVTALINYLNNPFSNSDNIARMFLIILVNIKFIPIRLPDSL